MKFTVNQSDMFRVLTQITGVLERTQTRDVLSHARMVVAESGELQISCTDLTMTMVANLKIESVEEPGSASLPGLRLFEIFRTIGTNSNVTFETIENSVEISFDHSQYQLAVISDSASGSLEMYLPSPPEDHVVVELPAGELHHQLLYTNIVMGQKESRAYMMATCFELTDTYFRTVATEASVLGMATRDGGVATLPGGEETMQKYLVPRKTVHQLTSMLAGASRKDTVKLIFGNNHFSAKLGVFSLTSNLLNTTYPDYPNVFPAQEDWWATSDRIQLQRSLIQADVVAVDSSHRVVWNMSEGILNMKSASTRNDRVSTEVSLEELTGPRIVSINAEKVLKLLHTMKTDKVKFSSSASDLNANLKIVGLASHNDEGEAAVPNDGLDVAYLLATMSDK